MKDEAKLDLQDKLDLVSTLISLKHRSEIRWEKAEEKEDIVNAHNELVSAGQPTGVDFDAITKAVTGSLKKALTDGEG